MNTILLTLFRFIASILLVLFCSCFLDFRKWNFKKNIFLIVAFSSLLHLFLNRILGLHLVISTSIQYLLLGLILFRNKKIKKITIITIYMTITIFIEIIIMILFNHFTKVKISDLNINIVYYTINYLIKFSFIIIIIKNKKDKIEAKSISIYMYQTLISLLSCIGIYAVYEHELENFNSLIIFIIILLFINLIVYYIFQKNELLSNNYTQKKIENEMFKYKEDYYKKLEEYDELKNEHRDQLSKILPLIEDKNIKRELDIILKDYYQYQEDKN